MTTDLRERLTRAIACEGRPSSDYDLNPTVTLPDNIQLRRAGVLVPIVNRNDSPAVVLTMRSSALKHHPGQIAFPGGKVEASDADEVAAALREAQEEISLDPQHVQVIGNLPSHMTVTGFTVTPVVALVNSRFRAIPEINEVAEVFEVPLDHLMQSNFYSVQSRRWRGDIRRYYTIPWGPYYIWGATARMLRALADRMVDDTC